MKISYHVFWLLQSFSHVILGFTILLKIPCSVNQMRGYGFKHTGFATAGRGIHDYKPYNIREIVSFKQQGERKEVFHTYSITSSLTHQRSAPLPHMEETCGEARERPRGLG